MGTTSTTTKVEITPFTIPFGGTPFDLTPKWTFDLPAGRKALVFEHVIQRDVSGPQAVIRTYENVKAYAVLVQRKSGAYENDINGRPRIYYGATILEEALDVKILIEDLAIKYAPKKSTVKVAQDHDDD